MFNYRITISTPDTLQDDILIALSNNLYINKSYQLYAGLVNTLLECQNDKRTKNKKYTWIENYINQKRPRYICSIAFNENNKAIGCLFINGFYCNIYVKSKYKRNGIGTSLLNQTSKQYNISTRLIILGTSKAAYSFQKSLQIPYRRSMLREFNKLKGETNDQTRQLD